MSILQKICCYFFLSKFYSYLCPDDKYEPFISLLLELSLVLMILSSAGGLEGNVWEGKMQAFWDEILQIVENGEGKWEEDEITEYAKKIIQEEVEEKGGYQISD